MRQGDVCWADFGEPRGSEPGFRRPVVVVQGDAFNRSCLATTICVPLTSNLKWREAPGNVFLPKTATGLAKDSVALVAQITHVDRAFLDEPVTRITPSFLTLLLMGLDIALGR